MPAGATYEPIATTTLAAITTSFSFSSISSSYTDLKLVLTSQADSTTIFPYIRFNSDTGTNYSFTMLIGNGTAASSDRRSTIDRIGVNFNAGSTSSQPTMSLIDIFSYAGSTNKTCLVTVSADQNGAGNVERYVGLWRNTSAINSITIATNTGNFKVGTTATLYGIKAA